MAGMPNFWCHPCQRWTAADEQEWERNELAVCSRCGHQYQCEECGFEIDRSGRCLRNETGPADVVGRCRAATGEPPKDSATESVADCSARVLH